MSGASVRDAYLGKLHIQVKHTPLHVAPSVVQETKRGGERLCFHGQAAQVDLFWHAAGVETFDLI